MIDETKKCDVCYIGHCHPVKAPYLYWVDDQVMVMPNSPALACDICGQVYFEPAFLAGIEGLLQEMERSVESRWTMQQPIRMDDPLNWSPSRGSN